MRGLLHHIAQLAGQDGLAALAFHHGNFRCQDRAAYFRPCQSSYQAYFAALVDLAIAELRYAQIIANVFEGDRNAELVALFHNFSRNFPAYVADFAFKVADTGFPRVTPDNG